MTLMMFYRSTGLAPLSLCSLAGFDLQNDTRLCPTERKVLRDFYEQAKGREWTKTQNENSAVWLDEYKSHCDWYGVSCNNTNVTELNLSNNGLSGKLSSLIGSLHSLVILNISDNDIKVSFIIVAAFFCLL